MTGFAAGYDSHRPSPPAALLDILCLEAQVERPRLVVDLGSGTGLSTRAWADRADEVVGVEASPEMRAQAEAATSPGNVRFIQAYAQETGLPDGVADIVTCSQSLPLDGAGADARRGGADSPARRRLRRLRLRLAAGRPLGGRGCVRGAAASGRAGCDPVREAGCATRRRGTWSGSRASGHFRQAREVVLHSRERGSAERIVGMALSLGPMVVLLQEGTSEEEIGLAALREAAARALGDREVEMFLGYRVRLGIR